MSIPDTLRRVAERLDPEEFLSAFTAWAGEFKDRQGGQVCIDGKTLKGAMREGKPLHLVSAWCEENRIVLGALSTEAKSNEIPAIEELLKVLTLSDGDVVTIDAMGCQKAIISAVREQGADYVIALKKNQQKLAHEIANFFDQATQAPEHAPCIAYSSKRKGHGREDYQEVWVSEDLEWLPQLGDWSGLSSVVMIRRVWREQGQQRQEKRYYISSLRGGHLSGLENLFGDIGR